MSHSGDHQNSLAWRILRYGILLILLLLVCYWTLGRMVLEKILTDLCMPLGIVWLSLTLVCVIFLKRRMYVGLLLVTLVWSFCSIAGNGILSGALLRSLERDYISVKPLEVEPLENVVVLGGSTGDAPNGQIQINGSGDRIVLAARMYHRGLVKSIVCTGVTIEGLDKGGLDQADQSRLLLMDLGVPETSIQKSGGRNTAEEMQEIAARFGNTARVGVITSAWHMKRAMKLAAKANLNAVPLPANFRSEPDNDKFQIGNLIRACIPNHNALSNNATVLKEQLAMLVGR